MKITIYQLIVTEIANDDTWLSTLAEEQFQTKTAGMKAYREANKGNYDGTVKVRLETVELRLENDGDWNVTEGAVKTIAEKTHE